MNVLGRVAQGVFGKPTGSGQEEDDTELERLLYEISDSRHAEDRRDAMSQLANLLRGNQAAQRGVGIMGLPVLLAVLQEDRDDVELLKGALEVLQLAVALPGGPSSTGQLQHREGEPPPALINADQYCHSPDNVLLLLGLLRDEESAAGDFYVKYGALQALAGLLTACPDKLQACVLSSNIGALGLMELLSSPMEVLRNEALLLLVGLCNDCPQLASIVVFEGAFDKLIAICAAEGGLEAGNVVVQDAAELLNNLLRDNLPNQRLFREMGHINQLPNLLQFTSLLPAAAPPTAAGMLGSASQYLDPALHTATGAAAAAAANTAVGAAAAAAAAVAGAAAAAAAAAWPVQVAANYLCLLETLRLLLAAPRALQEELRAQELQNQRANQDKLGQLGIGLQLTRLAVDGGGAPSPSVRAQALLCLGDLVNGHPQLQEQLAGTMVQPPRAQQAALQQAPGRSPAAAAPPVPLLQVVVQLALHGPDVLERAAAIHVLQSFCLDNSLGQLALLSSVNPSSDPHSVGGQLLGALLCHQPPGASLPSRPGQQPGPPQLPAALLSPLELQLTAGRAAAILGYLLKDNAPGQTGLLGLQLSDAAGDTLLPRCVRLLGDCSRRADGKALLPCCAVLRLLIAWCAGCSAAVTALLAAPSHLPLLVDLAGGRVAAGDVHTAGLAAVLLGVCLMFAPGSPYHSNQQQQDVAAAVAAASVPLLPGQVKFQQLLDIVLNRIGLSQLFGTIDDMMSSSAFSAAKAAPRLPAHITRGAATAALEAEAAATAANGGLAGGVVASDNGAWSLLQGALLNDSGGRSSGADGTPAAAAARSDAVQPYDHAFTLFVGTVTAAVQQLTLNALAGSAGGGAAAGGPAGAAGRLPSGTQQLLPGQQLPMATDATSAAALMAQLQGETAEQKLHSALQLIMQLQGSCEELRCRNRALAEDLIRISQSKTHSTGSGSGAADGSVNGHSTVMNGVAPPAAAGAIGGPRVPDGLPSTGPASTGGAGGLAEAESRVAAQLRASRAEMELGTVRQQLSAMQGRWSALEAEAAVARGAAEEARVGAAKAEADLAALSTAYNGLEAHAFEVEEQLRKLQQGNAAAGSAAADKGIAEAAVQARIQAAVEQDRQQRSDAVGSAAGGLTDAAFDARLAAAVAEARAAAEAEAGEEMEDLLACLGEEQAKVEVLSARLSELGEDVEILLTGVAGDDAGAYYEDGVLHPHLDAKVDELL